MKKEKLNVVFCSFPDFSSNAKPLYEYMHKRYKDKMNFYWVVRTDEMYQFLKKQSINVCIFKSDEYFDCVKNADVLFDTHGDFIHDKPDGTLYLELWHGVGPKAVGYLSNNLSDDDYNWCKQLRRKVDYFIVPSDFWRVIFSARFNVDYGRTVSLGYPKFDYFKDKKCVSKLEKVLGCSVREYDKIIYYMPTFRKSFNRQDSVKQVIGIFNVDSYDENGLISFLKKNNFLLCIKKHPSEQSSFSCDNENIKIITDDSLSSNLISINEILDASDLLITDYSSLGIEYVFLDKPVIYLTSDIDEYKKNRGVTFSDLDFWMPGYHVNNFSELLSSITMCFSDNYSFYDLMLQRRRLWFGDLKDGGCKNICDFFFENNLMKDCIRYYHDYEESLEQQNEVLDIQVGTLTSQVNEQKKYIDSIVSSSGWKFLEKLRKFKRKILRK